MFSQFIYQKNKENCFSKQKVNKNKLIRAKSQKLQYSKKKGIFCFYLKADGRGFFQSEKQKRQEQKMK